MTGVGGLTRFVLLRAREHRTLLAAALLTVLLTTVVLAALTAYAGALGDAALRSSLAEPRTAADAALIVKADVPAGERTAADAAVRREARTAFDGLPVTVRTLRRSGPYALPGTGPAGTPDLTYLAALDGTQVRLVAGRLPRGTTPEIEAALPRAAARRLGLRPGTRLTLADRLGGPPVHVLITGVYRPADTAAPYWQLDDLAGRGEKRSGFTTYGPLLASPAALTGGRVSTGQSAWLASADFSTLTTGRIDALRETARGAGASLRGNPALSGTTVAATGLPGVLDRVERSLLVSRSTLLVVALQLVLLAACALLPVARLLSAERAAETRLLRSRGASRVRIARLAALEALLLAVPSVVGAPLLAGPLALLLAKQGALTRIGLRLDVGAGQTGVWLVAVGVATGCALAVTLPVLLHGGERTGRARPLPAVVRAGADVGLLVVAAVAYWQLRARGDVDGDRGALGVDPLLVAAPALALLAGTVLTLRLLPPAARLAERRAAGGRGLAPALAGWQLSRRPMRQAGPVLLLVLATALGVLAVGQGASWARSQEDQADFRAGAAVRVVSAGEGGTARTERLAGVGHVTAAAPVARASLALPGNRTATVLAVDTAHAADTVLMRPDLADGPVRPLLAGLGPEQPASGVRVPEGTARLRLTATLHSIGSAGRTGAEAAVVLEDRWGTPHEVPVGRLPADGRPHSLAPGLDGARGPLTLTGLRLVLSPPAGRSEQHRLTLDAVTAATADGTDRPLALPASWTASSRLDGGSPSPGGGGSPTRPHVVSTDPPTVEYGTGALDGDDRGPGAVLTVRMRVARPAAGEVTGVATDRFLASTGAGPGQRLDVTIDGATVPVRIVAAVRALPTTSGAAHESGTPGTSAAAQDSGGALLVDLRAVDRVLQDRNGTPVAPTEWWLGTTDPAGVAATVRAWPDMDPGQVVVRDEIAARLREDPFGAGPEAAFTAAAAAAAALAAVGFAVSAAGSLRARGTEIAVLRALGAPRRRLARAIAVEHGVLVASALAVGTALGVLLTRAVVPLVLLTGEAARPVPAVLVALPPGRVAALLAAVATLPLAATAVLATRQPDPAAALRAQRSE
ncbi:ABC transporter permease [Streptomyces actuosus]|uniref:ABC transporter permease n=1 Tax=Streptomyces actuosus TaxID=1885 RepID=A0ABS2VTG5_STRAS|nr:ABC transporter permease [Streptomyces actuosus]MBN0046373.1 ABC transporter permease [Streptomyces actuosus]